MKKNRLDIEKATLHRMIAVYCKGQRHSSHLCSDCLELLDYSTGKLNACPFGNNKSFCTKCAIHCYRPDMRDKIRKVMRYAGPRMLFYAPVIAIKHFFQM